MEYQKYIDLFTQAQSKSISSILDSQFYDELTSFGETRVSSIIEKEFNSQMLSFIHKTGVKNHDFRLLEKKLLRQYLWTKSEHQKKQYDVFHLLFSHFGCKDEYSKVDSDWVNAITMAIYIFNKNIGYRQDDYTIENIYTKQFKSVEACKYFNSKNYDVTVKKGEIKLKDVNLIFNILDYQAKNLGGVIYSSFIKNIIAPILDSKSGLYRFPIASSNEHNEAILPLGLIFQLATKYINQPSSYTKEELIDVYEDFLENSKNYALIFECQNFGHDFEMILMTDSINLLDKIENTIITDNLYKVEQYIYSDVFDFVRFIAKKFVEDEILKDEINEFIRVLDFLKLRIDSNELLFNSFEIPDEINEDFFNIFTFRDGVNKNFKKFYEFDKIDFNTKILIKNNDAYSILHPQFFSIAVYRILYKLIESKSGSNSTFNSSIGTYIEDFIESKMHERKFNAVHGRKYKINKNQQQDLGITSQEGECDILLSTKNHLIFIEIKKKEFTPSAKKGNILFILDDLSKSLLASQKQANKHMRYISKFEEINFFEVDDKPEINIKLDQREILKISVSSLDYLSLHSKIVFQKFILLLYNKEVLLKDKATLEESNIVDSFNKLNRDLSEELNNADSDFQISTVNGFFNSFFMNIFHIVFLLNKSNDIEEFTARLISNRGIILPYNDFYHESIFIEDLRQSSTENQ